MKKFLLLVLVVFAGCSLGAPSSINIRVEVEDWSFEGPSSGYSYSVVVENGDVFGPEASMYTWEEGTFLFETVRILGEGRVKISFDDEVLMLEDAEWTDPPSKNPVIITDEELCFKTRTMDSGSDFCLRVD